MALVFVHSYVIRAFVAYFKNDELKVESGKLRMESVGCKLKMQN